MTGVGFGGRHGLRGMRRKTVGRAKLCGSIGILFLASLTQSQRVHNQAPTSEPHRRGLSFLTGRQAVF